MVDMICGKISINVIEFTYFLLQENCMSSHVSLNFSQSNKNKKI